MLSNEGVVINSGDGLKNSTMVVERAAVTSSQDLTFLEVSEGVFDNNFAVSEFDISNLLESRWSAVFRFLSFERFFVKNL